MADIVVPNKKLKQARLPFSKIHQNQGEDDESKKDDTHKKYVSNDNDTTADMTAKTSNKTSMSPNRIEVKADVHSSSIQCPEVSTSSIHSDSDHESEEMDCIDLTEENTLDANDAKIFQEKLSSDEGSRIDDAIDAVIARCHKVINDETDLIPVKRKRRSKSPTSMIERNEKDSKASRKFPPKVCSQKTVPDIVVLSPDSADEKPAKMRRSVLDMLNSSGSKSCDTHPGDDAKASEDKENFVNLKQTEQPVSTEFEQKSPEKFADVEIIKKRRRSKSPVEPDAEKDNISCKVADESQDPNPLPSTSTPDKPTRDISQAAKKRRTTLSPSQAVDSKIQNEGEKSSQNSELVVIDVSDAITPCKAAEDDDQLSIDKMSPSSNKKTSPGGSKPRSARKLNPETQKLKEEKEKEREEKKKQREEEKQAREQKKIEEKRKKEEEKLQREEEKKKKKEEQDRIKEEKLQKKQEELERKKAELEAKKVEKEQKEEEKRKEKEKREAEKKAKEDEKLKQLQEKQKLEEEKRKLKQKQASAFKSFFSPPPKAQAVKKNTDKGVGSFVPFQLKNDMHLPPKRRVLLPVDASNLDEVLQDQIVSNSYLEELKHRVRSCRATISKRRNNLLSLSEDGLEVVMVGDAKHAINIRAKLLQFSENVRPPYYGTWKRKSNCLSARNPLRKDMDLFDYEIDSDDEWEEPGEGEDIANSDGEDEVDKDEEDDDGDGFFVPHGYLSDDEGVDRDAEDEGSGDISEQKLKMKQQEFENSFKQKIKILTPITVGCIWEDNRDEFESHHVQMLIKYEAQFFTPTPIDVDGIQLSENGQKSKSESNKANAKSYGVPDEAIPDLIRLLHGNPHSLSRLVPEFQAYWQHKNVENGAISGVDSGQKPCVKKVDFPCSSNALSTQNSPANPQKENPLLVSKITPSISGEAPSSGVSGLIVPTNQQEKGPFWISKTQLNKKIKEIGAYGRKEKMTRACWFVLDSIFEKYSLDPTKFPVPCQWDYLTFTPDVTLLSMCEVTTQPAPAPSATSTPKTSIQKFASKVFAEDLLEKSKMRIDQEKEKLAQQQSASLVSVDKFTTAKIAPEALIEQSSRKIAQEQAARSSSMETGDCDDINVDCLVSQENASFVVPTHAAFKSFFKLDLSVDSKTLENNSTPEEKKSVEDEIIDNIVENMGADPAASTEVGGGVESEKMTID
ncbi:uncharacterized protein LOC143446757 [Clavelina lepadiformis]|uniref:uncharacterized protein LOC143446757 n=1 Tax=Clavelina lepadiformis TaxID=159417 RepID=UPI00404297C3